MTNLIKKAIKTKRFFSEYSKQNQNLCATIAKVEKSGLYTQKQKLVLIDKLQNDFINRWNSNTVDNF